MRKDQVFGSAWVHWLGTELGCTILGAARGPSNHAEHGKPITGPSEGHTKQSCLHLLRSILMPPSLER